MKTVVGILLLSLVAAPCAEAAEMEWKAGLATVKITPEKPVPMAGYASRTKPFEKVEQDIYAKALALEDREGHRAILVTTDLLGLSRAVAEPVCERIQQATKVARSQMLLNSAHTHSAPMLGDQDRTESGVAPEDARNIVAYTRSLQDQLVQVATQAWSRLEPAQLSWGSGVAHFAMNRREFTPRGVILGVNPRGLVDRTVPVLRVDSAEGKLRAILFGYACHNTTLTQTNYNLCGDYAGFAQAYIQEHQPGAQAMFMIGCGGDANPHPRGTMADARDNGATLGQEVCRILSVSPRPLHGPLTCVFDQVRLPLEQFSRAELERMTNGPSWQSGNAKAILTKLARGEKLATTYEAPVAVWQFGSDLTLVGLSGEVVVDYVPLIEQAIGPLQLWVSAYCNDVFGYFPSARVLKEGGYECRGLYTTQGFFAPAAQDVLVAKVRELAQRAGRELPESAAADLRKPPAELAEDQSRPGQSNLPLFWKSRLSDIDATIKELNKGKVRVLAKSAGGRNIYLVAYGENQNWQSTANYNSAVAGGSPASYAQKDGTQRPVVFLLGPVHGQELEGVVGLLNLIRVAETGRDFRGRDWSELAANLAHCRALIVPCGNPDGRARCASDSWVGEELSTHERAGMGTKPDGSNHTWPQVKRLHPMRGPRVATLGAYWNHDAINLMHDEWFDPMAPETRAWFKLAREEAPDFIVSLHSHAVNPSVEPTAYVPRTVKVTLKEFGDRLQKRYAAAGLPHRAGGPEATEDGETFPPPSFNLTSALHHACGAVSFVYECPVGVKTEPYPKLTHEQILDLQLLLCDELFKFAIEHSVKWTK